MRSTGQWRRGNGHHEINGEGMRSMGRRKWMNLEGKMGSMRSVGRGKMGSMISVKRGKMGFME